MKFYSKICLSISLAIILASILPIISYAQLDEDVYSDSNGKYLIITHDSFYDEIKPLAEWKYIKGVEVEIVKMSNIGVTPTDIKAYIQTAYNTWDVPPEYVLLVGDKYYVPTFSDADENSDSYYADVTGDFHEELYVGRFSVRANVADEIETVVTKTINYETTPYMDNTDWFTRACLIANYNDQISPNYYITDKEHVRTSMLNSGWADGDIVFKNWTNGSSTDINTAIQQGVTFINYRGKYTSPSWASPFSIDPYNTSPGYKLPIVFSGTSSSGEISYFFNDEFMGEKWLRAGTAAEPCGSVAFYGTWTTENDVPNVKVLRRYMDWGFFDDIFLNNENVLGKAVNYAKNYMYNSNPTHSHREMEYKAWTLQGDPELNMWVMDGDGSEPETMELTYTLGNNQIIANVTGNDVEGAKVCCILPEMGYYEVATVTNGQAIFNTNYNWTLSMILTATKPNHIPVTKSEVINSYNWTGDVKIITDFTVPAGKTLTISSGAYVTFDASHKFIVNGNVILEEEAIFELNHASTLLVDGPGAQFKMEWGSTVKGNVLGTDTSPGDRIEAKNGGKFTTPTKAEYSQGDSEINILGPNYNGELNCLWDGIYFENGTSNWLVNCDIRGVANIEAKGAATIVYLYDLTCWNNGNAIQNGSIITARNSGSVVMLGKCSIIDNYVGLFHAPIEAWGGTITVTSNGLSGETNSITANNGYGVKLHYASGSFGQSLIKDTSINSNKRGCYISGQPIKFQNSNICWNRYGNGINAVGPASSQIILEDNTIMANGDRITNGSDFYGNVISFSGMPNGNNEFERDPGQGYLLYATDYYAGNQSPIDVYGNTYNGGTSTTQVYPEPAAFNFILPPRSGREQTPREMYDYAMILMEDESYAEADDLFKEIIQLYPESNEALAAVEGVYWVQNFSDMDFESLREYLDSIYAEEGSPLLKVREDIYRRSYMDEQDWITAIEELEQVINDPSVSEDDRIFAMIDQGYSYMMLNEEIEEGSDRNLTIPQKCTIKTETFPNFRQKVSDLEAQLSFNKTIDTNKVASPVPSKNLFKLENTPNPFNPRTTIYFEIPVVEPYENHQVKLAVYDVSGRLVKTLVNEDRAVGYYAEMWDGRDNSGKKVGSGVYFAKLDIRNKSATQKMLMLK